MNGKDRSGKSHKDLESFLQGYYIFKSFQQITDLGVNAFINDCKMFIDRIVDFIQGRLQQAKKKQYKIVKDMTFKDLINKRFE